MIRAPRSLEARLTLALAVVVVLGVAASAIATYLALQSFIFARLDDDLSSGQLALAGLVHGGDRGGGPPGGPFGGREDRSPPGSFPSGTVIQLRSLDGSTVLAQRILPSDTMSASPANLPSTVQAPAAAHVPTFSFARGGAGYRVEVVRLDGPQPAILVVAVPLDDINATLQRLLLIELLVSAVVLAVTLSVARLTVRFSLRPLQRMGATASAIAAGDLSRRVEPAESRTEIGRLGLALNEMLHQIEGAFAERAESEQRLRRFVADASHELRTPLTSIRGYAELLRRGRTVPHKDAEVARRRIEQEAVRMTSLVDDMLLLARLDQGRPLEEAPVDVAALARDAVDDARVVAPGRQISLFARAPVRVIGDEMRLRQVVLNLVRNAIVHTPEVSPVEVRVSEEAGRVVLEVVDHGNGLPPDLAERVFEPFYRADPGRSRDRGGTGLGLSIVAAVVAAHGGRATAVPTADGGATFRVELPAADAPNVAQAM